MAENPKIQEEKDKVFTDTASSSAGKTPVENKNTAEDKSSVEKQTEQKTSGSYLAETEQAQTKKKNILQELFANGNKLITLPNSDIIINDETRRLVALFSDGTYLVSKDHRFDGPVYNFEKTIKKRKIPINPPQYIAVISFWLTY